MQDNWTRPTNAHYVHKKPFFFFFFLRQLSKFRHSPLRLRKQVLFWQRCQDLQVWECENDSVKGCGQIQRGREKRQHRSEDFPKGFQGQTPWWWKKVVVRGGLKGKEKHVEGGKVIKVKLQRNGSGFSQLSSNEYHGMELLQFYNSFATFLFLAMSFASCCSLFIGVVAFCASLFTLLSLFWYILILGKWEVFGPLCSGLHEMMVLWQKQIGWSTSQF